VKPQEPGLNKGFSVLQAGQTLFDEEKERVLVFELHYIL